MLRSVWWRSSAARLPRVSSLNRWSSRATRSSGDIDRTRAAASSIASGMPSRRRHTTADRTGVAIREHEVVLRGVRAVHEQPHRVRLASSSSTVRVVLGNPQRRHRDDPLACERETLPARRQHRHPRTTVGDRFDLARDRIEQMLAVVEHQQRPLRSQVLEHRFLERPPGDDCTRRLAASVSHTAPGRSPARTRTTTRRRGSRRRPRPRPRAQDGSCRRHRHR